MRLIDADELIEQMKADAEHIDDAICKLMHYALIRDIKHQPTVDTMKRGRWIDTGEIFTDQFSLDEFPIYECSVCGSRIERKPTLDRFCNWCGAKMVSN